MLPVFQYVVLFRIDDLSARHTDACNAFQKRLRKRRQFLHAEKGHFPLVRLPAAVRISDLIIPVIPAPHQLLCLLGDLRRHGEMIAVQVPQRRQIVQRVKSDKGKIHSVPAVHAVQNVQVAQALDALQEQIMHAEPGKVRQGIYALQLQGLKLRPAESRIVGQTRASGDVQIHPPFHRKGRDVFDPAERGKVPAVVQFQDIQRIGFQSFQILQIAVADAQHADAVRKFGEIHAPAGVQHQVVDLRVPDIRQHGGELAPVRL